MIVAGDIFNDVLAFLDDDGSGRYSETKDLVPAINKAIGNIVVIFNAAFEQKKISPESLRELVYSVVLPTTGNATTKTIDVTTLTANLWSIFGIDPDPITTGTAPNEVLSDTRNRWATRATLESWEDSQSDPFSAGTAIAIPAEFARPSYIGPGHYHGGTTMEVLVRPASIFVNDKVAVWYLKNPSLVATGASVIEFPQSLRNLLVDYTLNCLSIQHEGSGGYKSASDTKYGAITDASIKQLVSLMLS
jgi:hypothetical protein